MMNREKVINNLKIKYDDNIYDKIVSFSIDTWDGTERVTFTNVISDNSRTTVNCKFNEIEIITE